MHGLERDQLFVALTRPQMFAGVTYSYFVANLILIAELFLIFKAGWVLVVALAIHLIGVVLALRDQHFFDVWLVRVMNCPRVRNYALWRCNSYRP